MIAVDLPRPLRDAIGEKVVEAGSRNVARAAVQLSARYRLHGKVGTADSMTRVQAVAYAASRFPATFAAVAAALRAVCQQRSGWVPRTVLDLGAGPGAGIWAAARIWSSIELAVAVDAEREMIALGRDLAGVSEHPAIREARWIESGAISGLSYDLVLLSYVLGELETPASREITASAWRATAETLVLVEPGTPAGYARILEARRQLLEAGGFTTAPCPHDGPCPMVDGDWCHFAVRLGRSKFHRVAKGAELGFEDEKFSYVAVSREATPQTDARVLRHPQIGGGRITLELCSPTGLTTSVVTKADRNLFKRARKTAWGDSFRKEG